MIENVYSYNTFRSRHVLAGGSLVTCNILEAVQFILYVHMSNVFRDVWTVAERKIILRLCSQQKSYSEIAKTIDRIHSIVEYLIMQFDNENNSKRKAEADIQNY